MQRAYFVSDLHITSPDDPTARRFLDFLKRLSRDGRASHLFLLGDIFDLWLADHRYFVDRYRPIVDEIVRLRDDGVDIQYFEGNHDLHLGRFWADQLGLTVHGGPVYTELAGLRLRLEHGDQMDPDDRGYRFLRWFLRTPPLRFLICRLPGKLVARLGERASVTSRAYTSQTKTISEEDAIDKIRAHAALAHDERPFDMLISGHVHIRDDYRFETPSGTARSVNLGTWLIAPCYFRVDGSGGELVELEDTDVAQLPPEPEIAATDTP